MPQSRSIQNERPYVCPIEKLQKVISHLQSNLKGHPVEMQFEKTPPRNGENQKRFVCPENGCGKVFLICITATEA